ncbi:MAG: acyl-CoA thioesterase [Saprospiraceae bacterium]|nr:acyl-CoA thioesterase [Saprospiraceae bacterium]MBP7699327.1 acyl-CoA thioesterase [Saprospiraceae bacterium]
MDNHKISFQFISEPSDINYGGNVHGGVVMKWIDQTAYTCARSWSGTYCVTVYVGGIRFYKPINIGEVVRIDAYVIYTGTTSIHIGVDVYSRNFSQNDFEKKTHCVIVFVSIDEHGKPSKVKEWHPQTARQKQLEKYAQKLKLLREKIETEMQPFLSSTPSDFDTDLI